MKTALEILEVLESALREDGYSDVNAVMLYVDMLKDRIEGLEYLIRNV